MQMSDEDEARIVVEDLHGTVPAGCPKQVHVKFGDANSEASEKDSEKVLPEGVEMRGTITSWTAARNFGFITPEGGGPEVFLHSSVVAGGPQVCQRLFKGTAVIFACRFDADRSKHNATSCALPGTAGSKAPVAMTPRTNARAVREFARRLLEKAKPMTGIAAGTAAAVVGATAAAVAAAFANYPQRPPVRMPMMIAPRIPRALVVSPRMPLAGGCGVPRAPMGGFGGFPAQPPMWIPQKPQQPSWGCGPPIRAPIRPLGQPLVQGAIYPIEPVLSQEALWEAAIDELAAAVPEEAPVGETWDSDWDPAGLVDTLEAPSA